MNDEDKSVKLIIDYPDKNNEEHISFLTEELQKFLVANDFLVEKERIQSSSGLKGDTIVPGILNVKKIFKNISETYQTLSKWLSSHIKSEIEIITEVEYPDGRKVKKSMRINSKTKPDEAKRLFDEIEV